MASRTFGVLYDRETRWVSPLFDVVTTTVYPYERAGVQVTDRTMALRFESGGNRGYPLPSELIAFGRKHCASDAAEDRVEAIATAMRATLKAAKTDERIPRALLKSLTSEWEDSLRHFSPR